MTEDFFFLRPLTGSRTPIGQRKLPSQQKHLYDHEPKAGLIISTFSAPAYVELALAVRNRMYPDVPVLVHDDASQYADELGDLCQRFGATFQANSSRLGHEMGDLSSVVGGLRWANELGLDLLVKMSRRFVPLVNWVPGLQQLAMQTQYATFGRTCESFQMPIRTECFAMAVEPWEKVAGPIAEFMLNNQRSILIEDYIHGYAGKVYESNCAAAREFERNVVRTTPRPVYIGWPFVGPARKQVVPTQLWHDTASPAQYAELGRQLGLSRPAEAFAGYFSQAGL